MEAMGGRWDGLLKMKTVFKSHIDTNTKIIKELNTRHPIRIEMGGLRSNEFQKQNGIPGWGISIGTIGQGGPGGSHDNTGAFHFSWLHIRASE